MYYLFSFDVLKCFEYFKNDSSETFPFKEKQRQQPFYEFYLLLQYTIDHPKKQHQSFIWEKFPIQNNMN